MRHSPSVLLPLTNICSLPPRPARKWTLHLPGSWGQRKKHGENGLFWSRIARWEKMSNLETQF